MFVERERRRESERGKRERERERGGEGGREKKETKTDPASKILCDLFEPDLNQMLEEDACHATHEVHHCAGYETVQYL